MKKQYLALLLIAVMGVMSWATAQSSRTDLYDIKKSQQELEIMKGILSTTLSFVARELRSRAGAITTTRDSEWRGEWFHLGGRISNIEAFYLYGQGAVFIIPASSLRPILATTRSMNALLEEPHLPGEAFALAQGNLDDLVRHTAELEASAALLQGFGEAAGGGVGGVVGGVPGGVVGGVVGGVPGGVVGGVVGGVGQPARRAPSAQTPKPSVSPQAPEDIRKRLAEAQESVKKRREETEQKRAKFLEQLDQIKGFLIEALANHGDSLTQVKSNEYVTLVITSEGGEGIYREVAGTRSYRDVISVQKSLISDYKAGKINLDAFKQRVLQYSN